MNILLFEEDTLSRKKSTTLPISAILIGKYICKVDCLFAGEPAVILVDCLLNPSSTSANESQTISSQDRYITCSPGISDQATYGDVSLVPLSCRVFVTQCLLGR